MVVAPHHLASQAGLSVLREGGNAIEAMVAAASTIAAVYPHMNAIGGDGFWLISEPGSDPVAVSACGAAARKASIPFYREQGFDAIPGRGPLAALTVAGTISGWEQALEVSREWGGKMPLPRLLEEAAHYARTGVPVTVSQSDLTRSKLAELKDVPGFAETFLKDGEVPARGDTLPNPGLAATLEQLGRAGLKDFYQGDLAASMAADLEKVGSPVSRIDLESHRATRPKPLSTKIGCGTLYNMTPPTQGVASLRLVVDPSPKMIRARK